MARNSDIFFQGREGSTAISDALSRHPQISVPILEHLNIRWFKRICNDKNHRLADMIGEIFSENEFDLGDDRGYERFISENKGGRSVPSIGFKWRPHGSAHEIARLFHKHNVVLFFLSRRNFKELCASLSISKYGARIGGL